MISLGGIAHLALDTETTGLHWWRDKLFGIALTLPDRRHYYFDVREDDVRWLGPELLKVPKYIMHNGKFDCHFLREFGIVLDPARVDDTMIRAALLDENELSFDLDTLGLKHVGIGKDKTLYAELAALFGGAPNKQAQMKNISRAPRSLVAKYALQDTDTTLLLWEHQEPRLDAEDLRLVESVERELIAVLVDMEHGGVRVDIEKTHEAARSLGVIIDDKQRELNKAAGFDVNVNPSNSLKTLIAAKKGEDGIWRAKDGTVLEPTESGKGASIDAKALERMKFPEAQMVLALRKYRKTKETFLEGHILGHHHNGVIHANFNQTRTEDDLGTGTGRLSCNDPALQQITKRDPMLAAIVRALFLPDEGYDWACHDWSQMDFRMFVHYTKPAPVMAAYKEDPRFDFHQLTSNLTGLPRKAQPNGGPYAKAINLGNVFGMGPGKMAQEMGLPYTMHKHPRSGRTFLKGGPEILAVLDKYHAAIPGIREFLKEAESIGKTRGYVRTVLRRRIRFPRGFGAHKAAGLIFQGSAADALKRKMIVVWKLLKNEDARFMLNVHDEFDNSTPKGAAGERINAMIAEAICDFSSDSEPIRFDIPICSGVGVADNWWLASKD